MDENPHQSFTELEVWKKGRILKNEIKELTLTFPSEEKYKLTHQVIRSSGSINATIAEGHGRYTCKDHVHFELSQEGL